MDDYQDEEAIEALNEAGVTYGDRNNQGKEQLAFNVRNPPQAEEEGELDDYTIMQNLDISKEELNKLRTEQQVTIMDNFNYEDSSEDLFARNLR